MTTGVIYARVSSIGDRQSTERQVKDLSEYAKYKGIEVCNAISEPTLIGVAFLSLCIFKKREYGSTAYITTLRECGIHLFR